MKLIIFIIFILLIVIFYLIRYFDQKRDDRNIAFSEKRKEVYMNLLNSLKEQKDTKTSTEENNKAE